VTRAAAWRLGAAAASGVLLALARPPFDVGALALVALVPLLWSWQDASPAEAARRGFVAGVFYYAILVSWTWYFGAVAIVPLVALLAAYWAAVGALVAWLARRRLCSPWLTAAVWVVGEFVVARWPLNGFSWGEVGNAFHAYSSARALATVGGVPLLSFLAVAANAFVLDLILLAPRHSVRSLARAGAGLVVVAVLAPTVATITWMHPRATGRLHVALLQGNPLDRDLTQQELDDRYLAHSHFQLAETLHGQYDLVVFPESSMDEDPRLDPYLEGNLTAVARRLHTYVLANAVADEPNGRRYNLNVMYDREGNVVGTYAKRHLVPYGEYVPFRAELQPLIGALQQIPKDFTPGKRLGLFDVNGHTIGTVICFESAFAGDVRPLVQHGAQLIVVSTNNRSYRRSANSRQHLALSQMRAAETGRPVLQASISGITAVIDAHGNVSHETSMFKREIVDTTVDLTTGTTLYVRFGDWAAYGSLILVLVAVGIGFARRRDRSVDSPAVIADTRTTDVAAVGGVTEAVADPVGERT
jgi:apolipoprotein N-acyltransferase